MHKQFLQTFMNDKVPVTKSMGIDVVRSDDSGVEFKASIEANINDKAVAFGGSLFSVASLASWAVVDYILKNKGISAKIFVATSETKFKAPVTKDFSVQCLRPSDDEISLFLEMIEKKGRGRIIVHATIYEDGVLVFESTASYVAVL